MRTSRSSNNCDLLRCSSRPSAARALTDAGIVESAINFNSTAAAAPEFCWMRESVWCRYFCLAA
jgi:hypothetical protein